MNLLQVPIAVELFAQWRQARGGRETVAQRPFGRDWETLLEDAGIRSATDRLDAQHDAGELARLGWIQLKHVRFRPSMIDRVAIPLEQESRWREAFGYVPASDADARFLREFAWEPPLGFLSRARLTLPLTDLQALNRWLAENHRSRTAIPIKERSLEIFGDEKRLDGLLNSSLFEAGRLSLETLACYPVAEPLGWRRGPIHAGEQPVLVLENAATWHSYARWNETRAYFSAVIYGGGNRFRDSVSFLTEIFRELGGPRRVFYFGDLDPAGLRIPRVASARAIESGLPAVLPHHWSYRQLANFQPETEPNDDPATACVLEAADLIWLGELADWAAPLLRSGRRLAQEHIGWEFLHSRTPPTSEVLPAATPPAPT